MEFIILQNHFNNISNLKSIELHNVKQVYFCMILQNKIKYTVRHVPRTKRPRLTQEGERKADRSRVLRQKQSILARLLCTNRANLLAKSA